MSKIKATFLEGDTKYHISRPGGVRRADWVEADIKGRNDHV